jgi:signal transduction histidine kinase
MDEAGAAFRTAFPDSKFWADADPTRVAQIVGNLLNNSLKFTKPGGEVVLSLFAEGNQAEIRVRDSGAGIDPTPVERVFEPLVQADQSLARTKGGRGGRRQWHGGGVAHALRAQQVGGRLRPRPHRVTAVH